MEKRIMLILCVILLTGCISNNPTDIQDALSVQFFDKGNDKEFVLRKENKIYAVKTPTDRTEGLHKEFRFDVVDFEKLVYNPKECRKRYGILANSLPKNTTWEQLKPYLEEHDELYLLPGLDWGFVVIRNNHLFCMIITDHSM